MVFQNRTVYMVPVWYDSLSELSEKLLRSGSWEPVPREELETAYLIGYAYKTITDSRRFRSFRLKEGEIPEIHMYGQLFEGKTENARPEITEIRFSCFGQLRRAGCTFIKQIYPEQRL